MSTFLGQFNTSQVSNVMGHVSSMSQSHRHQCLTRERKIISQITVKRFNFMGNFFPCLLIKDMFMET